MSASASAAMMDTKAARATVRPMQRWSGSSPLRAAAHRRRRRVTDVQQIAAAAKATQLASVPAQINAMTLNELRDMVTMPDSKLYNY